MFDNLDDFSNSILNPKNSQAPAISDVNETIVWGDVPKRVSEWQKRALELRCNSENPILIFGHKEADYVIAILACFLLEIPYIPVDSAFPEARIGNIKKIANVSCVYDASKDIFERNEVFDESKKLEEQGLAYIMFTSGSTGEPKGVQIGRESILTLINWMSSSFDLGEAPVFMSQAPFSFDLSCYEIYGFLGLSGHCVLNASKEIESVGWYDRLFKHKVGVWVSTPSFAYSQVISTKFNSVSLPQLHTFLFCGEVLPSRLVNLLRVRFPTAQIINSYGPTEATVATTYLRIDDGHLSNSPSLLPIGNPMPNVQVFPNESGELVIIGDNVMRGYLNRDDLNASKLFFDKASGMRGFKTGDLGYEKDGLLFCKGRLDSQIKLHGYRIELDEVESVLCNLPSVHQAVVLPLKKADGSVLRLIGFYVPASHHNPNQEELKHDLASKLPEYMVPSELVSLEALPHNSNNKVDRKKILENYSLR